MLRLIRHSTLLFVSQLTRGWRDDYIWEYYLMDYSSNMNIIVTVISIIINSMGGMDYYRLFISQSVICGERKGGESLLWGGGGGFTRKRLWQLTWKTLVMKGCHWSSQPRGTRYWPLTPSVSRTWVCRRPSPSPAGWSPPSAAPPG